MNKNVLLMLLMFYFNEMFYILKYFSKICLLIKVLKKCEIS